MKNIIYILLVLMVAVTACKKDKVTATIAHPVQLTHTDSLHLALKGKWMSTKIVYKFVDSATNAIVFQDSSVAVNYITFNGKGNALVSGGTEGDYAVPYSLLTDSASTDLIKFDYAGYQQYALNVDENVLELQTDVYTSHVTTYNTYHYGFPNASYRVYATKTQAFVKQP